MLALTADQADRLARLAAAAFPREACALLLGSEHGDGLIEVTRIVVADNIAATPEREFELDPAVHIRLLRELREAGGPERIVGHWHSHPNGRDEPSAKDAAMASDPGMLWLISAVAAAGAGPPRGFRPQAGPDGRVQRFEPVPVEITDRQ